MMRHNTMTMMMMMMVVEGFHPVTAADPDFSLFCVYLGDPETVKNHAWRTQFQHCVTAFHTFVGVVRVIFTSDLPPVNMLVPPNITADIYWGLNVTGVQLPEWRRPQTRCFIHKCHWNVSHGTRTEGEAQARGCLTRLKDPKRNPNIMGHHLYLYFIYAKTAAKTPLLASRA